MKDPTAHGEEVLQPLRLHKVLAEPSDPAAEGVVDLQDGAIQRRDQQAARCLVEEVAGIGNRAAH
jgi:hypothetical protein